MLLRMSEEDQDYEGKWPKGGAMTKPTVESVMRMIHDNEFMRNDDARDKIRAAIESLAAPAAPVLLLDQALSNENIRRVSEFVQEHRAEVRRLREFVQSVADSRWIVGAGIRERARRALGGK